MGLLHGVGRVTNPKSNWISFHSGMPNSFRKLIAIYILEEPHGDSYKFVHDPEEIAAFFQSQSVVFVQFLQENYLNTMRTIEEAAIASDILSLADVLNTEWRVSLIETSFLLM